MALLAEIFCQDLGSVLEAVTPWDPGDGGGVASRPAFSSVSEPWESDPECESQSFLQCRHDCPSDSHTDPGLITLRGFYLPLGPQSQKDGGGAVASNSH